MPSRKIVVTDLTRFQNDQMVCIAGIDVDNGECIRPMPYLETSICQKLKILPGAILTGDFTAAPNLDGPHQEDMNYKNLQFHGASTSDQFKSALNSGLFKSVEEGFEIKLSPDQKHIPLGHKLTRSIITIKIKPTDIDIVEDEFNVGRIKLHLADSSGHVFKYLPITDLGFYRHAIKHHESGDLESLNAFLKNQDEIYIRVGLPRNWPKRPGYWMQINGIYTFPKFNEKIRSYA